MFRTGQKLTLFGGLVVFHSVRISRSWVRHKFFLNFTKLPTNNPRRPDFRSTLHKCTDNGVSSRSIFFSNAMFAFQSAQNEMIFLETVFCKSCGWIMFCIAAWYCKCFDKSLLSAFSLPKQLRNTILSLKHQNHWIDTNSCVCWVLQVVLNGTRRCCMEVALRKNGLLASIQKHLVLQPISGI